MVASPNLAAKAWVTSQYDRYVLGNTVLAQPEDAGHGPHRRGAPGSGVALATDGNGRWCRLDPYAGAQLALAEAYRNVATSGARPLAVTNCLNFGSPEDPAVMWQFAEAVRGLADGCLELGVPVTGGNVSFYNQTGDVAIQPTPVVGVLGVIDDVAAADADRVRAARATWCCCSGRPRDELGGSEWAHEVHGHLGGRPPVVDLPTERALAEVLVGAAARRAARARRTTCPTAGWRRRWSRWRCGTAIGAAVRLPGGARPVRRAVLREPARAVVAVPRRATSTTCCGAARTAGAGDPAGRRPVDPRSRSRACSRCRSRSCGPRRRRPSPPCSADRVPA